MALPADMPVIYPIDVYQGSTFAVAVNVLTDGVAADLTGASAAAQIRNRPGGSLVATFTVTITGNTIEAVLPPEQSLLVDRDGWWDLRLTFANGSVRVLLAGAVTATQRVTE